jgi:hypothetical protein
LRPTFAAAGIPIVPDTGTRKALVRVCGDVPETEGVAASPPSARQSGGVSAFPAE